MANKLVYILCLLVLPAWAQTDSLSVETETAPIVVQDSVTGSRDIDPLSPSRAAFYSAVVPGLGQAYNKKYWKIPIVYAGIATGIYFYIRNDNDYNRFRDAYKRRLAGFEDDEFFGPGPNPLISTDRLLDAQRTASRNRDVSLVVALAFYLVNIIDANVDAHLKQYNVSEDLSLQPNLEFNPISSQANYGLQLTFRLK